MRLRVFTGVILLLCLTVTVCGQEQAAADEDQKRAQEGDEKAQQNEGIEGDELRRRIEKNRDLLVDAGMDPGRAMVISLLTSEEIDPMTVMMIMGMLNGDGGGGMEDMMGMAFLSQNMKKGRQAAEPNWFRDGQYLYIVEDRTIQKIDYKSEPMEVASTFQYKKKPNLLAILMPMLRPAIAGGKKKAEQAKCQSNMKQLMLAILMYGEDHDETLPGETWTEEILPYAKNKKLFKCPSRPQLDVGYALNEKVIGANLADIDQPARAVAMFESNTGGPNPIGNAADVPDGGVHKGGINVGFMDGHTKWVPVQEARRLLETPIFE